MLKKIYDCRWEKKIGGWTQIHKEGFKFLALRLILLGNDREHRRSGTATRHSGSQDISRCLCKTMVHYRVYIILHLIELPLLTMKSEL